MPVVMDPKELLTFSELARQAGRSADFLKARIDEGTLKPYAKTPSGILLFQWSDLPAVMRPIDSLSNEKQS